MAQGAGRTADALGVKTVPTTLDLAGNRIAMGKSFAMGKSLEEVDRDTREVFTLTPIY